MDFKLRAAAPLPEEHVPTTGSVTTRTKLRWCARRPEASQERERKARARTAGDGTGGNHHVLLSAECLHTHKGSFI